MDAGLRELQKYVNEMKATSSGNDKKEIIAKYIENPFIAKALVYENSPFKQYNVTSKNILKKPELLTNNHMDLFDLLDDLNDRNITGHNAIACVNGYINLYPHHKDLILNLIDKDLKTRAGASLINKVKPGHIPEFDVALAQKYEPKLCDFENETWYASRKLDGCRCIVVVDEFGKATAWSRQGKQFETLGKVIEDIEKLGVTDSVFDGEICIVDEDGNEDFQSIMKEIRRKDHTIQNPKYIMFDLLNRDEFDNKISERTLYQRLFFLTGICPEDMGTLSILKQELVMGQEDFDDWQKKASDGGWEGFMLRRDCEYEGKRSKNLLKVKTFFDDEYVVKGMESEVIRVIRDSKETEIEMLSNIVIEHKGYEVKVGSGFTQEQRIDYHNDPDKIVGKTITVQYFEETTNKDGGVSLRFPVIKYVYNNGRDC